MQDDLAQRSFTKEHAMLEFFTCRLRHLQQRRTAIRKLALLDDHLLIDIGAERGTLGDFVDKRTCGRTQP